MPNYQIGQSGQFNVAALNAAGVYVQIVPPQSIIQGVGSNVGGIVGFASWGPLGAPMMVGSVAQAAALFGPVTVRKYDLITAAAIALSQGPAGVLKLVRVTDGTDTAASAVFGTTGVTISSKYTGVFGNKTNVIFANGTQAGTWKVSVSMPGLLPEIFDNIGLGLTANPLWVAIATALNSGISSQRGPSQLVVASAGVGILAPTVGTTALAGGTDGAATPTETILLGVDTLPRSGMYALRGQNCSAIMLADANTAATTWAAQNTFGLSEGAIMIVAGAAGETIASATTTKATAAIDTYAVRVQLGDWLYWNDSYNGLAARLVSPQAFALGLRINLSPEQSSLNKSMQSVVGTQKSASGLGYTSADIQALNAAGIDVIAAPSPGGNYFACQTGRNASSDPARHGDNYTTMTNFLAVSIANGIGGFIGQLQDPNPADITGIRRKTKLTLDSFLGQLKLLKMISDYQTVVNATNNTPTTVGSGYLFCYVKVVYLATVEYLVVNLEGGQTVQITSSPVAPF